jgi:hypothetical protein
VADASMMRGSVARDLRNSSMCDCSMAHSLMAPILSIAHSLMAILLIGGALLGCELRRILD